MNYRYPELVGFRTWLEKRNYSFSTVSSYIKEAEQYLVWLRGQQLNYQLVSYQILLEFLSYAKEQGNKPKTVNQKLLVIKHLYEYCKDRGLGKSSMLQGIIESIESLKVRGTTAPFLYEVLSKEVLEGLYQNFPTKSMVGVRNKCITGMLVYQGLKAREIANMKVEDIDLEQGSMYIQGSRRSNGRKLILQGSQIALLQRYMLQIRPGLLNYSTQSSNSERLFLSQGSGQRLQNALKQLHKQLCKQYAGLANIRQIRYSVIRHWLKQDNIRLVQYKAGHKHVSSTQSYRSGDIESLQSQIERLHPLNKRE